jgi:hypothetical protein
MIISGHQPSYLPWLGFFEKIARSDIFVFHDTAQFEKHGFLNRNKVKTASGAQWITVPMDLTGYRNMELRELPVRTDEQWRRKHWKTIQTNYGKAPYFAQYRDYLFEYYAKRWERLVDLNMDFTLFVLQELQINTRIEYVSCNPQITGRKSDLVLSLCQAFEADRYYSGLHGKDYLIESDFAGAGIEVVYQEYEHPTYPQLFDGFLPYLSILDLLMNCGPESREILLRGGRDHERIGDCRAPR